MSLVGPRPEEVNVVALYSDEQRIRSTVKPGLTGPMQVYGRGDLTFEERLSLERDYLNNLSIARDIAILLRTPAPSLAEPAPTEADGRLACRGDRQPRCTRSAPPLPDPDRDPSADGSHHGDGGRQRQPGSHPGPG